MLLPGRSSIIPPFFDYSIQAPPPSWGISWSLQFKSAEFISCPHLSAPSSDLHGAQPESMFPTLAWLFTAQWLCYSPSSWRPSPLLTRAAALSPTSGPYPPVRPHHPLTPYLSSWSLHVFLLLQLSHFSLTLCDPIDGSPPGCPVPGILQARTLEWVAISFSNAWKWKVKVKSLSRVWLFETPWTAAYQAPPSMGYSRQEYWSGVPLPSPVFMLSCFNCVWLCATLWTVACQASLSVEFPRQEYWRGLPCPPPGALPGPRIEPLSLMSPALADGFFTTSITLEVLVTAAPH